MILLAVFVFCNQIFRLSTLYSKGYLIEVEKNFYQKIIIPFSLNGTILELELSIIFVFILRFFNGAFSCLTFWLKTDKLLFGVEKSNEFCETFVFGNRSKFGSFFGFLDFGAKVWVDTSFERSKSDSSTWVPIVELENFSGSINCEVSRDKFEAMIEETPEELWLLFKKTI